MVSTEGLILGAIPWGIQEVPLEVPLEAHLEVHLPILANILVMIKHGEAILVTRVAPLDHLVGLLEDLLDLPVDHLEDLLEDHILDHMVDHLQDL